MYNVVDMEESFVGSPIWAVVDTVSNQPSDGEEEEEEEALSFCNLAIYAANDDACLQDPKNKSLESTEDFEFASFGSNVRPAEDLFYKGQLLPLHNRPESDLSFRKSSSCKEMRAEKVKAWRMNSLDSQINYWSSSGSMPHRQHEGAHYFNSSPSKHKIKSKPPTRSTASAPSKAQKSLSASSSSSSSSSLKWQFFTLGLMKTPQMKLEDIRQRQGRPSISDKIEPCPSPAVLKRSVSCIQDDSQPSFGKAKATNTERHKHKLKSRSVKENMACSVEAEKPSSSSGKGWKMLKPLTALNGCRASTSSVINCSTKRSSSSLPHHGFNNHNLPFTARMHGLAQAEAHFKVSA